MRQPTSREQIAAVLTQDNVVAWLRTKDPNTEYEFCNKQACLLCQFLRDMQVPFRAVYTRIVVPESGEIIHIPPRLALTLLQMNSKNYTFGKALEALTS